ncbi:MAG: hypothetical protein EOO46_00530 [Flavobacterium sp.]|nr:MAG: hypothetical protein EOO46_00530 [Flavobacterium sp.]
MALTTSSEFKIEHQGQLLRVTESKIDTQRIFHVRFPDGLKTLVLTVGVNKEGVKFWTSVPPKRLTEAKEIGPVIAHYFKNLKK